MVNILKKRLKKNLNKLSLFFLCNNLIILCLQDKKNIEVINKYT